MLSFSLHHLFLNDSPHSSPVLLPSPWFLINPRLQHVCSVLDVNISHSKKMRRKIRDTGKESEETLDWTLKERLSPFFFFFCINPPCSAARSLPSPELLRRLRHQNTLWGMLVSLHSLWILDAHRSSPWSQPSGCTGRRAQPPIPRQVNECHLSSSPASFSTLFPPLSH